MSGAGTRCALTGPRTVLKRGGAWYPSAFQTLEEPPERLYVVGNPDALTEGLAIVGARKATPYGLGCARRFGKIAAERGLTIISGGAHGCDAAAHRAALEAGTQTVAFLGGGADRLYPTDHAVLFQRIVDEGGAVVSELPWEFNPRPWAFRQRNRLIASLAKATLIVEAGLPSGTFSTADEALAANREVLVVPGAITSASSRGANRLIAQGATPIVDDESFEDALVSIFSLLRQESMIEQAAQRLSAPVAVDVDEWLLAAVSAQPLSLDELYALWCAHHGSTGAWEQLSLQLAEAQRCGVTVRYAGGQWGPKV